MSNSDNVVTREDIERQLNVLERIANTVSGDDDILYGIIQNQATMLQQMGVMVDDGSGPGGGSVGPERNIRLNQAGIAVDGMADGEQGQAIFEINGEKYVKIVEASGEISNGDVIYVSDRPNVVSPSNNVDEDYLLGTGSAGSPRVPTSFNVAETDGSVTIDAGEEKELLDIEVNTTSLWWETGTKDAQYTGYNYEIDGEERFDQDLRSPLGLFNDRFRFPQPIRFNSNLKVIARRDSGAPGPEQYVSKIVYYNNEQ